MALLHKAQLTPTKIELLSTWVPSQPWWAWDAPVDAVDAYRFDDPAGAVGIETHLLRVGDGPTVQVPLTYRDAPLEGAESAFVGMLQHSVLGQRWVYDGCYDPVYATALATAILTGGTQAELRIASDNGFQLREPTARVTGSGTATADIPPIHAVTVASDPIATTIQTENLELVIRRVLGTEFSTGDTPTLAGVWTGNDEPTMLALARTR